MKDTRPIEMQVATLTPEQRAKIPKIFKTALVLCLVPLFIFLLTVIATYARVFELREEAELHSEMIDMGVYDFTAYDEYYDMLDEVDKANETAFVVTVAGAISIIVYVLVVNLVISKRYPFYSEKRYYYLKKLKKTGYTIN